MELNELIRRNVWLNLLDTSPWRATSSEECDAVDIDIYIDIVDIFTPAEAEVVPLPGATKHENMKLASYLDKSFDVASSALGFRT